MTQGRLVKLVPEAWEVRWGLQGNLVLELQGLKGLKVTMDYWESQENLDYQVSNKGGTDHDPTRGGFRPRGNTVYIFRRKG